tara:strand:- start:12 stop:158 length:147 start_codon:yes stop_codon:yes gene_type:complete
LARAGENSWRHENRWRARVKTIGAKTVGVKTVGARSENTSLAREKKRL